MRLLALIALLFAATAQAQPPVGERRFVADATIAAADGHPIRYRTTAEDIDVGVPGGRTAMFAYAYEALDAGPVATRPVIFAYNGGQVSSSAYLHMGLLGPKLLAFDAGYERKPSSGRLVDNPDPLLDVADIVVIDAPNTGFGRMLDGTPPTAASGTAMDADAFAGFVRTWLERHGRRASPLYLMGESYGSVRSAAVVERLRTAPDSIRFAGIILFGQALDQSATTARTGNDLAYTLLLPSEAATAWYHKRAGRGQSRDAFVAAADAWAKHDYIAALLAEGSRSDTETLRIATTLARFTGLPRTTILVHDLRIDRATFARELLKSDGAWLSQNDGRLQQPPLADSRLDRDRMETDIGAAFAKATVAALAQRFGGALGSDYRLGYAHPDWAYVYPATRWWYDYTPLLADAMKADPAMRLFFGCGVYDILTPAASARHAATHAGVPADRVTYRYYGAGHMPYLGGDNQRAVSHDVRRFILAGHAR